MSYESQYRFVINTSTNKLLVKAAIEADNQIGQIAYQITNPDLGHLTTICGPDNLLLVFNAHRQELLKQTNSFLVARLASQLPTADDQTRQWYQESTQVIHQTIDELTQPRMVQAAIASVTQIAEMLRAGVYHRFNLQGNFWNLNYDTLVHNPMDDYENLVLRIVRDVLPPHPQSG